MLVALLPRGAAGRVLTIAIAPSIRDRLLQAPPGVPAQSPEARVVLPILLGPGEELAQVDAPWPVLDYGTGFYHGMGIAHLGVRRLDLARSVGAASLRLVTRPAVIRVAQRQRADPALAPALWRDLGTLVVNPSRDAPAAALPPPSVLASPGDFHPTDTPSLEGSPVQMLILTRDALVGAFQGYADYRTGLGVPTVVRSVEWVARNYPHGADLAETLRNFVRDAYEMWGIRSLLLGGDTDLVPTRFASSLYSLEGDAIPTDLYYACLDGNWNGDLDGRWGEGYTFAANGDAADLYPELWVGRLPVVNSTQVEAMQSKLHAYLEPASTDWQNKILFLAEVIWPVNYRSGDPITKNGADIAEELITRNQLGSRGWSYTRLYETPEFYPGSSALTRGAAIAAMQSGYGIVADIGHGYRYTMSLGDASLTNVQALALANATKPFFLNMLNCSASAYDFPSLAEKFILNPTGGAIGVIGASREAYPDNIQLYQAAWFSKLLSEGYAGAAEALHEARLKLLAQTYEDGAYRWSNFITVYLGDPELELWVARPRPVQISAPASIPVGSRSLLVTVTDGGHAPQAGVRVCAWKPGDFYAVGRTNLAGSVTLSIDAARQGIALVSAAGAGVQPVRTSVSVGPTTLVALHVAAGFQVQDSGTGTRGNGNGQLEGGETALLRFTVENQGGSSASSATLQLSSSEPSITVGTATAVTLGTLAAGASVLSPPISVSVGGNVLDGLHLELQAELRTSLGYRSTEPVGVDLLQVRPAVQQLTVNDQYFGNGNGVPEAGETYDLVVDLKNYGGATLQGASGTLTSSDPDVTIVNGTASFGDVPHLGVGTGTFRVREASVSQVNPLRLRVRDDGGRSWDLAFDTRRPQTPSGLAGDVSIGRGMVQLTWTASASADRLGYVVYRATRDVGPWTRASTDAVQNALQFVDDGLADGCRYFYRIATVDSSGNESWRTPTLDLTTNPGQPPRWPLALGMWSNSSPAIADLGGDRHPEIIVGASDRIYAWNPDGTELRDGDGNPTTSGPWNNVTGNFMPGLAAGDLDGDGRDEVVGCTFDTRQVYVFEGDGSVRPGWPRSIVSTTLGIWATPALGDLDLDGRLEIVVLALDGRLYAWHADGSEVRDGDANPATQGVFFVVPGSANWSRGAPAIAPLLPDDATPEIIFGTETSRVYVLRANGSVAPGWPRTMGGKVSAAMSIGDIDHDGGLEIAVPCQDGMLYVLRRDGTNLTGWPRPLENKWTTALTPAVALHDFDGDGKLELVAASTGSTSTQGKLYRFDSQGNVLTGWPVDVHSSSEASPLIGDLDGDGVPEIVFGGESGILYGYRPDGRPFPGFPIRVGAEVRATPLITDADADGHTDLLFCGWDQQVYLWKFSGLFVRRNVPWGTLKGNLLRNGVYQYREPSDPGADALPRASVLRSNVPNPFNPATEIRFDLAAGAGDMRLVIYDVRGRRVRLLARGQRPAGRYSERWDGRDDAAEPVASGIYFARLVAADATTTLKLVLLR